MRTLQRWYYQAIRAAGIEKKGGPHTARHTFATILRAKGFSLDEIEAILGDSSRMTTEIYAKLSRTPDTRDRCLHSSRAERTNNDFLDSSAALAETEKTLRSKG